MSMAKGEPGLTTGLQGAWSSATQCDAAELTHSSRAGKRGQIVGTPWDADAGHSEGRAGSSRGRISSCSVCDGKLVVLVSLVSCL